jgi:hypothetical protein
MSSSVIITFFGIKITSYQSWQEVLHPELVSLASLAGPA